MLKLIKPTKEYKDSYIQALKELQSEGVNVDHVKRKNIHAIEEDFEGFIRNIQEAERGIGLPEGYIAHTELWLVDNGDYIGTVDIRHTLTPKLASEGGHIGYSIRPSKRRMGHGTKILELALAKAKELSIDKIFVTCDDNNTASAKIIEKNGGILENKITNSEGIIKRRYWIENK